MDVGPVRDHIEELVDEERQLRESHPGQALDPDKRARLAAVEAELDACWDVLRRRRTGQPEGLHDSDVPAPPNELEGGSAEPRHLEHGVHGDGPSPDPGTHPNAP